MDKPKTLFHYTNINSLALILSTRKLKFNRLDLTNDPDEGLSGDCGSQAGTIYISSWTEEEEETFAMWNMYTDRMRGVRIEMDLPLFNTYDLNGLETIVNFENNYDNRVNALVVDDPKLLPYKIEYTDDKDLLYPNIYRGQISNDLSRINVDSLGKYKRKIWTFENEWRFRIDLLPGKFKDFGFDVVSTRELLNIKNYFIEFSQASFYNMKIRLGPKCIQGDLELISALCHKYNPSAVVELSDLGSKIK